MCGTAQYMRDFDNGPVLTVAKTPVLPAGAVSWSDWDLDGYQDVFYVAPNKFVNW